MPPLFKTDFSLPFLFSFTNVCSVLSGTNDCIGIGGGGGKFSTVFILILKNKNQKLKKKRKKK